jgi:RNA polymerase-binding transcription factor DksA
MTVDNADFVTELNLRSMDEALAVRRSAEPQEKTASMHCIEAMCGALIPWQRRFAVANCLRCMKCQMILEGQGVGDAG